LPADKKRKEHRQQKAASDHPGKGRFRDFPCNQKTHQCRRPERHEGDNTDSAVIELDKPNLSRNPWWFIFRSRTFYHSARAFPARSFLSAMELQFPCIPLPFGAPLVFKGPPSSTSDAGLSSLGIGSLFRRYGQASSNVKSQQAGHPCLSGLGRPPQIDSMLLLPVMPVANRR
jgi:hypothetical protein